VKKTTDSCPAQYVKADKVQKFITDCHSFPLLLFILLGSYHRSIFI